MLISFALGSQREPEFPVEYGLYIILRYNSICSLFLAGLEPDGRGRGRSHPEGGGRPPQTQTAGHRKHNGRCADDLRTFIFKIFSLHVKLHLLPTGSEERGVLGVGNIPVAILSSCQDIKTIAL